MGRTHCSQPQQQVTFCYTIKKNDWETTMPALMPYTKQMIDETHSMPNNIVS